MLTNIIEVEEDCTSMCSEDTDKTLIAVLCFDILICIVNKIC